MGEGEPALEGEFLDVEHLGVVVLVKQKLLEIPYVLDLAGLGHPVPLFLELPLPVKLHHFFVVTEYVHEKKEAADYGACPALPVVAVEYCHSFGVLHQKVPHFVANGEKSVETRSLVVLPVVADHVLQNVLIDGSAADVDSDIFVIVAGLEEFTDGFDVVAV